MFTELESLRGASSEVIVSGAKAGRTGHQRTGQALGGRGGRGVPAVAKKVSNDEVVRDEHAEAEETMKRLEGIAS